MAKIVALAAAVSAGVGRGVLADNAPVVAIQLNAPAMGTCDPITGSVTGLTGPPSNYKVIALVSGGE